MLRIFREMRFNWVATVPLKTALSPHLSPDVTYCSWAEINTGTSVLVCE